MKNKIWIVGGGNMGIEYSKILTKRREDFTVIGRSEESAKKLKNSTGLDSFIGGLDLFLSKNPQAAKFAIVCVGVESLQNCTKKLIQFGVKNILVEKPAGLNANEVIDLYETALQFNSHVYVAYNRRFYSSVLKSKELIERDGGVLSFTFDFTEMTQKIEKMKKAKGVKENWLFANSTHVIDLAFFLGGSPQSLACNHISNLDWHPSGSVFVGNGLTINNIPFSYHSNWNSAGRWGVILLTESMRLVLSPLEKLQVQQKDSFDIKYLDIDDSLDTQFKPGLYEMVNSFLSNYSNLKPLKDQVDDLKIYSKIGNYNWL
tara:strand:+ start:1309 stop:2259 length:951 start_codon:yes stop_codon:yes gene_type:complete